MDLPLLFQLPARIGQSVLQGQQAVGHRGVQAGLMDLAGEVINGHANQRFVRRGALNTVFSDCSCRQRVSSSMVWCETELLLSLIYIYLYHSGFLFSYSIDISSNIIT